MPARPSLSYSNNGLPLSLPELEAYRLADERRLLTPALLVYPEQVNTNIQAVLRLMDGDANRWRAHVKSAKLRSVMTQLVRAGVTQFKCATTLELAVACEAGARDILLAYPTVGPKVERVIRLAAAATGLSLSVLVEDAEAVRAWAGSRVGLFVDVNPGMNRTGIPQADTEAVAGTARAIRDAGLVFRGVHYYDGHVTASRDEATRSAAFAGYDRLLQLVASLESAGLPVAEIVTAGTPALAWSLAYPGFRANGPVHRASPGTLIYNDLTTTATLPAAWNLRPAALVAATVVSHPAPGRITCDAGHKSVSADAGVPTCLVLGRPDLEPLKPSEEHLPIAVAEGAAVPAVGDILYLVPRHVCPTVNSFDEAVLVRGGRIEAIERVAARGHERPVA
jgi:D-serine deaminase-like pyridoxal phosphate-dependent protein